MVDVHEEKAYKKLEIINTQEIENNYLTEYFNTFIKYKMWKFTKDNKLISYLKKRHNLKIIKEKFESKINYNFQKQFQMEEFCQALKENWVDSVIYNVSKVDKNVRLITHSLEGYADIAKNGLHKTKSSKMYTFKMYNLSRIVSTMGSHFKLESKYKIKIRYK